MADRRPSSRPNARPITPRFARSALAAGVLLGVLAAVNPSIAADQPVADQPPIRAVTRASQDLRLAFPVAGRVAQTLVEPGDLVTAGQPLIILERDDSAARVELLRTRAESPFEIERATAAWELAKVKEAGVRKALERNAGATFELQEAELETRAAFLTIELLKQRQREAQLELQQAEALHAQRELTAAIDGVIDLVLVSNGDTVEAFDPIARLVDAGLLWVDAYTPTSRTLALRVGDPAWVRYTDDPAAPVAEGVIKHLAQVADASSGARLVRVEINNENNGPAGRHVEVFFGAEPAAANRRAAH